jgi:foldase protein PrsA
MIGKDRASRWARGAIVLAAAAALGVAIAPAVAQQARTKAGAGAADTAKPRPEETPTIKATRHLVDPNEPVAIINGEPISRQRLADECVARKGEEILETMIARTLVDQAIRSQKLAVTPKEVDAEITRVAQTIAGVSREKWLATLAQDRHISPMQYARDIIYPSLALRKLALPRVKVTDQDVTEAIESQYGEKLRCRLMMFNSLELAKQVWEELKKNPAAWDKLCQQHSIDQATRAVGGMLSEPIPRHAEPRKVTDSAFQQLVDLDSSIKTKDPVEIAKQKPKDGDITGPIEVEPTGWVILRREGLVPPRPYDPTKTQETRKQLEAMILESKVQTEIGTVMNDLVRAAAIDNKLTGTIKIANEEEEGAKLVGGRVPQMSDPNAAIPKPETTAATPGRSSTSRVPAAVSAQDVKDAEKLKRR